MNRVTELKRKIIESGYKAVEELIKVAEEKIITHMEDDLTADKLKNAAASKRLAITDAFEILKRIEDEQNILEGVVVEKNTVNKGFAEKFATKKK
jgi:hypothetical protein